VRKKIGYAFLRRAIRVGQKDSQQSTVGVKNLFLIDRASWGAGQSKLLVHDDPDSTSTFMLDIEVVEFPA